MCWFNPLLATVSSNGLIGGQELRASTGLRRHGCRGPRTWAIFIAFAGHHQGAGWKWSSQHTSQCPYGMLAPQVEA